MTDNINNATYQDAVYGKEQCFVRHHSDPIRFLWSIDDFIQDTSIRNISLNLRASKMSPNFCLALQLFSNKDKYFIPSINESFHMNPFIDGKTISMIEDVRYRMFCYYQRFGDLDFEILPKAFCLKRNEAKFNGGCSYGFVNQQLDLFLSKAEWKFTPLRQQYRQYETSLTSLEMRIPIVVPADTTDVQLHLVFVDMYSPPEPENFLPEYVTGSIIFHFCQLNMVPHIGMMTVMPLHLIPEHNTIVGN
ncbi:predicted protein [Naegleria gruberi]|uniref:Predicted protein n=1 Tax=Naegleria gruberi TaxID=5762 RepID=D2VHI0_NAEGR|nr:uncharacterized protein NAEGRDRAFT_68335 [Naegleria gruberi]EFC43686.1 predicted protein [Naegleria gruberi]|eukprot:XP_002676430.1 predicted protein [Naegleria gruberi strain NEG-M]